MIHLDTIHRTLIVGIFLFGLVTLYITWFTDTFINRQGLRSLSKSERAKAIPLWVGLITGLGLSCVAFAADVLLIHRGLFR